jgi:hypothetical protein
MALLDSDRDSTVEVIVAFPNETYGSPGSLNSFVLSYNINHSNGTYSLTENWKSSAKYNSDVTTAGEYQKPIPQIADLDGDGTPEVLVYNKIYNAHATEGGTPRAPILTLDDLDGGAYVGADKGATHYGGGSGGDTNIPFSYIYDMDGDGIYDVVAGGKIYKIAKSSGVWGCTAISMSGVADGRTGVADINGDGIADVVTATRTNDTDGSGTVRITVWNPGFKIVDASGNVVDNSSFNATTSPHILAQTTIPLGTDDNGQGNNSYIYIGDIDGLEQEVTETGGNMKKYRLPEIAILGGPYRYAESQQHPNVVNSANPIPTFGNSYAAGTEGVIAGFTWDANPSITNVADRLKLSFILGHADRSVNTGFTMFDFDNDGMQEICYRDEQYLRIIKASRPYIPDSYTGTDVVMFRQTVNSYTGFEYPAIADIDKDASAEMIVMGHENGSGDARGYIYAVGNGTGDKFAPALPVWNQFMYDPFKIKPDLTTYTKAEGLHALDRLSPAFTFRREVKDENNEVVKVIEHYNPFNGTLLQVPYFTFLNSGAGNGFNFEPIVYLTEAYISDNDDPVVTRRPQITGNSGAYYIEVTIGNLTGAETDIPSSIPVAVYKNNQVSKAYKIVAPTPLSALYYWNGTNWNNLFGTNRTVQAGDTVKVRIPLPASEDGESVYIVRLGDNSDLTPTDPIWRWGLNDLTEGTPNPNLGIGIASRQFRDCNWEDQSVKAARNQVLDDTQTVQEFHSVTVNIWDNDILPDTYFANNLSIPHDSMEIIQQPLAGSLTFSGTGIDSRITYNHDGRSVLANAIDSFQYRVSFWDDTRTDQTKKDSVATVYIYVLESATGGFASCGTGITTVTLANKPAGVNFDWYEAKGDTVIGHGLSRTLPELKADSIYQIHPIMPTGNYAHLDFPKAKLTVSSFVKGVEAAVMRWTGRVNHNWKNPDNWVEVKGTYETPVSWAPMECVDVVIPSGATNYPEITDSAWCGNITMKDRAMLKNPHILTYEKASVEIKLTPHEKDSFIMWSAPLKDMYSGDYHFTKSNAPNWGDTYMMFFQMGHPDNTGVVAAASTMTGTVGNPGFALPLGKAFNFRLTATSVNRDSVFTFPKRTASYTGDNNLSYTTQRTDDEGYRFITDVTLGSDTTFDLPVANNVAGANFVQVVNPYLAWLNVGDFLAGNTGKISGSYLSWNGNVNTGIVAIKAFFEGDTLRYWIPSFASSATGGGTTGEIAPLQSFFVKKTTPSAGNPFTVKMSPNWTTTTGPSNPYVLRSSANTAPPLLYVRASQGEKSSSAVLHFDPKAFLNYDDKEDVIQLFYDGTNGSDGIPLTVYTLTPQKEPLAINSSGDFSSIKIPLGLRVRDPGEITLSFSGQSTFLHTVTLIDEELKKETDLRTTSGYTFTVSKAADSKAVSINDRFTLRMRYTGTGVETPEAGQPAWSVSGGNRRIEIQAHTGLIRRLHIYNVTGALVYATNTLSTHFSIPLEAGLYIVRAQVGDAEKAEKVSVR